MMRSPTKLLIAALITAGTVGATPAVAGAWCWGGHGGPPCHHHRPPCHGTTTTSESTTSTSETTTTING